MDRNTPSTNHLSIITCNKWYERFLFSIFLINIGFHIVQHTVFNLRNQLYWLKNYLSNKKPEEEGDEIEAKIANSIQSLLRFGEQPSENFHCRLWCQSSKMMTSKPPKSFWIWTFLFGCLTWMYESFVYYEIHGYSVAWANGNGFLMHNQYI